MSYLAHKTEEEPTRKGIIMSCRYLDDADDLLSKALETLPVVGNKQRRRNTPGGGYGSLLEGRRRPPPVRLDSDDELSAVVNIAIRDAETLDDLDTLAKIKPLVEQYKEELLARRVRRLTFVCGRTDGSYPGYYTFRGPTYDEDDSIRHVEPALAFQLELGRLSKFKLKPVFTENKSIHVYEAVAKNVESVETDKRYFTRTVIRPGRLRDDIPTAEYLTSEADRVINDIFDALEIIGNNNSDLNHVFLNFGAVFQLQPKEVEQSLQASSTASAPRAWRLRVAQVEIRIICTDPSTGMPLPLRVIITNTSGYVIEVEIYAERKSEKGELVFNSIGGTTKIGSMHLLPVSLPYPTKNWAAAEALQGPSHGHPVRLRLPRAVPPSHPEQLDQGGQEPRGPWPRSSRPWASASTTTSWCSTTQDNLAEVSREPGTNSCGMVGWLINARTPEYPRGRKFVVVANDITFNIGSFGPKEDNFFYKCTELARKLGIPRIYLSANSGARLGLANELMPHFKAAWNDAAKPELGFKYLYLDEAAKGRFSDNVITEEVTEDGEKRHKIVTIIGNEEGLGVECLRGSGLIAGATSRAYNDIFTVTLVTCRSVGMFPVPVFSSDVSFWRILDCY